MCTPTSHARGCSFSASSPTLVRGPFPDPRPSWVSGAESLFSAFEPHRGLFRELCVFCKNPNLQNLLGTMSQYRRIHPPAPQVAAQVMWNRSLSVPRTLGWAHGQPLERSGWLWASFAGIRLHVNAILFSESGLGCSAWWELWANAGES